MFCGKCGFSNSNGDNFCKSCGAPIKTLNPLVTIEGLGSNQSFTKFGVVYNPPFTLWSLLEQGVKGALIIAILFGLIGFLSFGIFGLILLAIVGLFAGFILTILFSVAYSSLKNLNFI